MFRNLALVAVLLTTTPPAYAAGGQTAFDYLALVLSWSPTYCASGNGKTDQLQCGAGRHYAFVVHGLWPQRETGWPEYCDSRERYVPERTIAAMLDIMPSKRLIIHEWKKHGTCSHLGQADYFAVTRALYNKIKIPARYLSPQAPVTTSPDQLVQDFTKTNAWLDPGMISVQCGNRRDRADLHEIRFCFDKAGAPRNCGKNEARSCRAERLNLPPAR